MDGSVLVTGAAGLLGTWFVRSAPSDAAVVAGVHRRPVDGMTTIAVDLRDHAAVRSAVERVAPRIILHAAYAKDHASIVDATRHVVGAAAVTDAHVVFVSSDMVFAGDGRVRDEDERPDATLDYGRWKAAAERVVLDGGVGGTVVRLPLLVSLEPEDHLIDQIRSAHRRGETTGWFTDEFRQPVWGSEVAQALWRIVGLAADERVGCWHLPGPQRLSRFEHAQRMVERIGLPASSIEATVQPAGSDRPRDIALGDGRARHALGWQPTPI